jgi:hypothetical protein
MLREEKKQVLGSVFPLYSVPGAPSCSAQEDKVWGAALRKTGFWIRVAPFGRQILD